MKLLVNAVLCAACWASSLQLKLSDDGSSYQVFLDGGKWLSGKEVVAAGGKASDKTLVTVGSPALSSGTDKLGKYEETAVTWALSAASSTPVMIASYKTYPDDSGLIVFSQSFPSELNQSGTLAAQTIFPSFDRKSDGPDLDCFSYRDVFPGMQRSSLSKYRSSHAGGVPLTFYDGTNTSLPMTVFSPLDYPVAHHMAETDDFVGAGVKATVSVIPEGWKQSFILSAGSGIKDGMMAWGDRMLKFTGKERADMYMDDTHGKIGFWTDNGGFYHYSIGNNKSLGSNYEEVLPKVKQYHDDLGVPFGHWQFDSWFYPKDGGVNPGGGGGAVTNWTADPSVFPHGMAYIQSKLGLPTVMHNRQWSISSDYIKNLPYKWYTSEKAAVPEDPQAFFDWFFQQQKGWGLSMYEQDWMCTEYDEVAALQKNITMGDLWLKGMAEGAEKSGRSVQYCMPYANHILSAASYSAVTNARATGDYFHANNQWAVGGTSLFYWAIGILPFKDGFYSSTNAQVGGQTVGPETNPDRETLMATLSCAMVGPMDGIYLLNKTRIMSTCMADGTVLKPDAPVHTSDWCFLKTSGVSDPRECFLYHTYSDVQGLGRVHYHYDNDNDRPLTPNMVYVAETDASKYAVYNWYSGELVPLLSSTTLAAGYEGHVYATVTPIVEGWVVLGEVDKYVTVASKRVAKVSAQTSSLTIMVNGIKGEQITVCAAKAADLKKMCNQVAFVQTGSMSTSFH